MRHEYFLDREPENADDFTQTHSPKIFSNILLENDPNYAMEELLSTGVPFQIRFEEGHFLFMISKIQFVRKSSYWYADGIFSQQVIDSMKRIHSIGEEEIAFVPAGSDKILGLPDDATQFFQGAKIYTQDALNLLAITLGTLYGLIVLYKDNFFGRIFAKRKNFTQLTEVIIFDTKYFVFCRNYDRAFPIIPVPVSGLEAMVCKELWQARINFIHLDSISEFGLGCNVSGELSGIKFFRDADKYIAVGRFSLEAFFGLLTLEELEIGKVDTGIMDFSDNFVDCVWFLYTEKALKLISDKVLDFKSNQ